MARSQQFAVGSLYRKLWRQPALTKIVVALLIGGLLGLPIVPLPLIGKVSPAAADSLVSGRMSVSDGEAEANSSSGNSDVSGDGRYVAFNSFASNLVAGDTNGQTDVFVRDRATNSTERVSISSAGAEGNASSSFPAISPDGRFVAFSSSASNLVAGDANGAADVFVRDRWSGTTELVSVSSSEVQGNLSSEFPAISPDGRFVAFTSFATNLVTPDTNAADEVFLRDRWAGTTVRVSVPAGGGQANSWAGRIYISLSYDGRYVAFASFATNMVAGDTNAATDIFVRDVVAGATTRVSVSSGGVQSNSGSGSPAISGDGRYVAFGSNASNLVGLDFNGTSDVFVRDRATNSTTRVSVSSGGVAGNGASRAPDMSGDGRFVVFDSDASTLSSGDTNGRSDVFIRDTAAGTTERVSFASDGSQANLNSFTSKVSAGGRYVVFEANASNLVPGDANGTWDVFLTDRVGDAPVGGSVPVQQVQGSNPAIPNASSTYNCAGDPCNTRTGAFFETFNDFEIPGRGYGLTFARTYNSLNGAMNGSLGYGWTHNWAMSLHQNTPAPNHVTIRQESGAEVTFDLEGGLWKAPPRVNATLVRNVNLTWTFTRAGRDSYVFDTSDRLVSATDSNGYATTLAYNGSGELQTITDTDGRALTLGWTSGHITSVTDPESRVVEFDYDGSGDLREVTDVGTGVTKFTYDGSHRMLTWRKPRFNAPFFAGPEPSPSPVVTNVYDGSGRIDTQTDELGRVTDFDFTSIVGATKVTDPEGNVTVDYYDADGLLTQTTKGYGTALAASWEYEYDPATLGVTKITDPNGHVVTNTYDSSGNVISTVDPLGREIRMTYNTRNQPLTVTTPLTVDNTKTVTTSYEYDANGNIRFVRTPLLDGAGATIDTQVNESRYGDVANPGDMTSTVDALGNEWVYGYDAFGYLESTTAPVTPENPDGNEATSVYNDIGWMLSTVAPKGNVTGGTPADYETTFDHNAFGDVIETTDPLGHVTMRSYDANGNVDDATDASSHVTDYVYDNANQLVETIRPDTSSVFNEYWDDGRLKAQIDGAGERTDYTYDSLGHLSTVTDPLSRVAAYTSDSVGNLLSRQDPGGNCAGGPPTGCTTYTYDVADQRTGIDYSDAGTPDVSAITYDGMGRRTAMTDGTGTHAWEWDSLGRLTSHTDGGGATTDYGWDIAGNLTTIEYPASLGTVTRTYDDAGRWESITDWTGTNTTTFEYDEDSNLVSTVFPAGTDNSDTYTYDRAERHTASAYVDGVSTVASLTYGRDNAGQLTSTTPTGVLTGAEAYSYTALDQLEDVNVDSYAYDAADNLVQLVDGTLQKFDAGNQLCYSSPTTSGPACASPPVDATAFTYDTVGNRTVEQPPASGTPTTYDYDQERRLTTATVPGAGGTDAWDYAYDGDGTRVAKTGPDGGAATAYTWDTASDMPLLLTETTGGNTTAYLYGPGGLPIARRAPGGSLVYYHHDQIGSTRLLTDNTGAVVGQATYDAYGNTTAASGITTPLGYTGQYTDPETGLIYLRARYYDPSTGQFITRDPLGAMTLSPYAYVDGNPLNDVDPLGLYGLGDIVKVGAVVAVSVAVGAAAIAAAPVGAVVLVGGATVVVGSELALAGGVVAGSVAGYVVSDALDNVHFAGGGGAGRNDPHGDAGRAQAAAERRIAELTEQLAQPGLSRKDKDNIKKKINNIRRSAERDAKGETHGRRAKGC